MTIANPAYFIGPTIDVKEATRLDNWIHEAIAAGATISTTPSSACSPAYEQNV